MNWYFCIALFCWKYSVIAKKTCIVSHMAFFSDAKPIEMRTNNAHQKIKSIKMVRCCVSVFIFNVVAYFFSPVCWCRAPFSINTRRTATCICRTLSIFSVANISVPFCRLLLQDLPHPFLCRHFHFVFAIFVFAYQLGNNFFSQNANISICSIHCLTFLFLFMSPDDSCHSKSIARIYRYRFHVSKWHYRLYICLYKYIYIFCHASCLLHLFFAPM